jgi:hypothetical protein
MITAFGAEPPVFQAAGFVSCKRRIWDLLNGCEVISVHLSCSFGGLLINSGPFALIDFHLLALRVPQFHRNPSFAVEC